jgi:hemolysin activation/secretion protein
MREAQAPAFRTKIGSTRIESPGAFATAHARCNASFTIVAVLVAAFASFAPTPGVAQHAAPQPSFDPRQTERLFDSSQTPQRSDRRRPPLIIAGATVPQPAADTKPLFNLTAVSVNGAVAIPADAVAATYQSYLGKRVSQADLAAIAAAITDHYRAAGYFLSRAIVPPQDIRAGRIRIEVIEGSITEVRLKGEGAEQLGIGPLLAPVQAERPARLATLERQMLLIGDRPGVRLVDTTLEELGEATGTFRLVVHLQTWRIYSATGADNLGSSAVGPWQTYATAAFNSYLVAGDTLAVNLSTVANDPSELRFGRLSYDAPVGTDGIRIGASGLYSEVWPGDFRRESGNRTRTETFELRGSIAPLQSQAASLIVTAAFGFNDVSQRDIFGPIYDDRIRTLTLTGDYRFRDDFKGVNYLTVVGRQGLDILGASQADDLFLSRPGAAGDFSVFNVFFARYQTLADEWSVKITAASQLASMPLLLSQQFYLGGAAFGRGYGSGEISGDNAMAGSLELRFDQTLNKSYLKGYQLYGFVDTGVAWNVGYRYTDGLSLTSAGGGARLFLTEDLQAGVGVAFPLTYRAADNFNRNARLLFSLSSAFRLCPERARAFCS